MKTKFLSTIFLLLFTAAVLTGCSASAAPVLSFDGHQISTEEFSLYCEIAKRNLVGRNDLDALYNSAIEYAIEVYGLYDLAAELEVSDEFSFNDLKNGIQQENEARNKLLQSGQPVMGILQFGLSDYLEYLLSECRYNIALAIAKKPSSDILEGAEDYYEANKEDYISDATYTYQVLSIVDGKEVAEVKTVSQEDLMVAYHSSDLLGDVLLQGNIGEEYTIGDERITVLDRSNEYYPFSDVQEMVTMAYVEKQWLPEFLEGCVASCDYTFDDSRIIE